jgi:capsular polysaccharide biosynthesis protein
MQDPHKNKHAKNYDDEIDLRELFYVLLQRKWLFASLAFFISIFGVIYSLSLPNIYESKTLLVTVKPSSGGISATLQNNSLMGLAGISLPSGSNEGNSEKAIQKIKSLSFFENNILTNINLQDLMAVESWNPKTNKLTYNDSVYVASKNIWAQGKKPSSQESFKIFKSEHLNLTEDKSTGFFTISIKHQSPYIAKQWVELVVNEINSFYRQKDKSDSERALNYLNKQISLTSLSEIKQVIAELLQVETQKLTLIEANRSYVFDYIDPPAVMEKKSEPYRAMICLLITLFGSMLSIVIVFIKHYFFSKKAF